MTACRCGRHGATSPWADTKHLSRKCGSATFLDPRGGRAALAGLGALSRKCGSATFLDPRGGRAPRGGVLGALRRNKRRAAPSVSHPPGGRTTYVVGLGALSSLDRVRAAHRAALAEQACGGRHLRVRGSALATVDAPCHAARVEAHRPPDAAPPQSRHEASAPWPPATPQAQARVVQDANLIWPRPLAQGVLHALPGTVAAVAAARWPHSRHAKLRCADSAWSQVPAPAVPQRPAQPLSQRWAAPGSARSAQAPAEPTPDWALLALVIQAQQAQQALRVQRPDSAQPQRCPSAHLPFGRDHRDHRDRHDPAVQSGRALPQARSRAQPWQPVLPPVQWPLQRREPQVGSCARAVAARQTAAANPGHPPRVPGWARCPPAEPLPRLRWPRCRTRDGLHAAGSQALPPAQPPARSRRPPARLATHGLCRRRHAHLHHAPAATARPPVPQAGASTARFAAPP